MNYDPVHQWKLRIPGSGLVALACHALQLQTINMSAMKGVKLKL